jgi:exodeoxyribonuclease V alpha subunit
MISGWANPETAEVLARLESWRERDWLRRLDVAFARFMAALPDQCPPEGGVLAPAVPLPLLLASALLSKLEGRGHCCLPLQELVVGSGELLGFEPEALAELRGWWSALIAADPAWYEHWLVDGAPELLPAGSAAVAPLVWRHGRLYLRRFWNDERRVAQDLVARAISRQEWSAAQHALKEEWLPRLFPPIKGETDWQREACEVGLGGRVVLITGGPGTGKTYTAARLYTLLQLLHGHAEGAPLRVALAAPTGKAAGRLHQSIAKALGELAQQFGEALPVSVRAERLPAAQTLHRLLGARPDTRAFKRDAGHPIDCDVLFIDEASMVDLEMMDAVLAALPATALLVLLGDPDQLESVEAGAVLADLCAAPAGSPLHARVVKLQRSLRFSKPIGTLAAAINAGSVPDVWAAFNSDSATTCLAAGTPSQVVAEVVPQRMPEGVPSTVTPTTSLATSPVTPTATDSTAMDSSGYLAYAQWLQARPAKAEDFKAWARELLRQFDTCRVLCAVRKDAWGVEGLNKAIEQALARQGLINPAGDWYEGRPVMVTRNDASVGVANGDVGLVLRSPEGGWRAWFAEGDSVRSVGTSRLADVQTAFALTIHKSQGSEFGQVVVALGPEPSPHLTRELLYTAVTRASQSVTVVAGTAAVVEAAVERRTLRAGGLELG